MDKLYQSLKNIYITQTLSNSRRRKYFIRYGSIREVEPLIVILNNGYGIRIRALHNCESWWRNFIRLSTASDILPEVAMNQHSGKVDINWNTPGSLAPETKTGTDIFHHTTLSRWYSVEIEHSSWSYACLETEELEKEMTQEPKEPTDSAVTIHRKPRRLTMPMDCNSIFHLYQSCSTLPTPI